MEYKRDAGVYQRYSRLNEHYSQYFDTDEFYRYMYFRYRSKHVDKMDELLSAVEISEFMEIWKETQHDSNSPNV